MTFLEKIYATTAAACFIILALGMGFLVLTSEMEHLNKIPVRYVIGPIIILSVTLVACIMALFLSLVWRL